MSPRLRPEMFFLASVTPGLGQRLAIYHAPQTAEVRGAMLYLHPFGEEMNKSRRMAAWQAREFARAGYAVLQIDHFGCGDSSGDFGDATWEDWLTDACQAAAWLRERHAEPLRLWGLRAGCLVAAAAARRIEGVAGFIFWQPIASGKLLLQQFLRQRLAADLTGSTAKATMDAMRSELAAGLPVEIAGYKLSAALAAGLEAAALSLPADPCCVTWLEVSSREEATLAPASLAVIERWRTAGHTVGFHVVPGPMFWQTSEIEDAPRLIDTTLAALAGSRP